MNILILGISSKLGQALARELEKISGVFLYGIGRRHINRPSYLYAVINFSPDCNFSIPFDCKFDLTFNLMWDATVYGLNFRNTYILLNVVEANIDKFRNGQFIHISSTAVYSPIPLDNDIHIVDEQYPTVPLTQYGKERINLEQALTQFCQKSGIQLTILRLGNVIHSFDVDGGFQSKLTRLLFGRYFIYVGLPNAYVNYVSIAAVLKFLVSQCARQTNDIGMVNVTGATEPLNSFIKNIFGASVVIICLPVPRFLFNTFRFGFLRNETYLGFYLKYRNLFYCNFIMNSKVLVRAAEQRPDLSDVTQWCIDPAVSAQAKLPKHKAQQAFASPGPGGAAGGCKSQSGPRGPD